MEAANIVNAESYARSIEASLDALARAGEAYPYDFRFRSGQALQLYELSRRISALRDSASQALKYAIAVDPQSAELVGALLVSQLYLGDCDGAKASAYRMKQLAVNSERGKWLRSQQCPLAVKP